ncbi:hypothetical protein B0O99DRAFT_717737 [Bisporella sp. PMI_857]|nr:hypothetical protein B0O99DRAFT_717737 [Bisporella sp. PMI_857]
MGKKTKAGEEMIVVGVEKLYENEHGVALSDKRNWIFRSEITTTQTPAPKPAQVQFPKAPEAEYMRDLIQTPVSLFRFSALTFNAHKIHYNKEWCQEVEGHRDIVVHGPLNLINMVNLWRDVQRGKAIPKRVIYRATSPLYAGEKYRVLLEKEKDKISDVKIVDNYGQVSQLLKTRLSFSEYHEQSTPKTTYSMSQFLEYMRPCL